MNAVRCPQCGIHIPTLPCWSCEKMPTVTAFGYPKPWIYERLADHIEQQPGPVNVQSMGAQIGTETWTLAMHLADRGVTRAHITASDANPNRLAIFHAGRYERSEVAGDVKAGRLPAPWAHRYLTPDGPDHLTVTGELRSMVTITEPTHMPEELPSHADVLMLRNVWLHLEDGERSALVDGILRNVSPDGLIYFRAGTGIPLAPHAAPFLYRPEPATPTEGVRAFADFHTNPPTLIGYRREGREAEQIEAWRKRAQRQVELVVRKYGYRDTPGHVAASRPDTPLVVYRGASVETWNGMHWSPSRETAEGYAAASSRAGWDGRLFTTTADPQSVIHQLNRNELWIHPDTLTASAVDMSGPVAPLGA